MTKLSKKLANASVEDAPSLLKQLYHKCKPNPVYDRYNEILFAEWNWHYETVFIPLLNSGPEGWLSAVMMLVPEGWAVEIIITASRGYSKACLSRYGNDIFYCERGMSETDPALALASAIAQTMEKDDD